MKKAQAAMEFLMTYGWAILVLLAAIAALAYFGVLSPEKFLPEKCTLAPGIACMGHKIEPAKATIVIQNGMGKDLTITSISIGDSCSSSFSEDFGDGTQKTLTITGCSNGDAGDRFKGEVRMDYTEDVAGLNKTMYGSIAARVE